MKTLPTPAGTKLATHLEERLGWTLRDQLEDRLEVELYDSLATLYYWRFYDRCFSLEADFTSSVNDWLEGFLERTGQTADSFFL